MQTERLYDEFWKALNHFCVWCKSCSWCDVLENKPARLKKKARGLGGAQPPPPHLQTQRHYDAFWKGPYGFCLCWRDDTRSDLAQLFFAAVPPQLETECREDEFWKALNQFCVWCKSCSWRDVLESKPASPPFCKRDVFLTGSERVHVGSVFAGRMILEASLLSIQKFYIIWYHFISNHVMSY